jgi:hypothetical protein
MNTENEIIIYDPKGRNLDLNKELEPFFRTESKWENSSISGSYIKCAKYLIMRRLSLLGMKSVEDPIVDRSEIDTFELLLYSGIAVERGHEFNVDERNLLTQIASGVQMIMNPDVIPPGPHFDTIRNQFERVQKALEIFK